MTSLRRDWEELASLDPYWAILSDKTKQFYGWQRDEFFQTGAVEIAAVMKVCDELGYPKERQRALDFGCGVGRLTRALADHFALCAGVDISETMIARAKQFNPQCEFTLSQDNRVEIFPDRHFDMIYSNIVLQHQPSVMQVRACLADLLRVLKRTGLLVFQLPYHIPLRYRLQPRRRLYHILRTMGLHSQLLYNELRLNPISMLAIAKEDVLLMLEAAGGRTLRVLPDQQGGPHILSHTYYVTRA